MSKLTDIAAKIDDLLDEHDAKRLPTPGGEYDLKSGWAKRLGMSKDSSRFTRAWALMLEKDLIVPVKGQSRRGENWQRHTLYKSPYLASQCD